MNIKHLDTLVEPGQTYSDKLENVIPGVHQAIENPYDSNYGDDNVVEFRERLMKHNLVAKSMKGRFSSKNPSYKLSPAADTYVREFILILISSLISYPIGDPWEVN